MIAALCAAYPGLSPLAALGMRTDVSLALLGGRVRMAERIGHSQRTAPAGGDGMRITTIDGLKAFLRRS